MKALFSLLAVAAVLGAVVPEAAASTFITTVTYTGTITSGGEFDNLNTILPYYYGPGCFPPGCGLGTPYTLSFTFESPPGSLATLSNAQTITGGGSAVLTVNGQQLTFSGTSSSVDEVTIAGAPPDFNFFQSSVQIPYDQYAQQAVGSANMQLLPVFTNVADYSFSSSDVTPQGSVVYDVGSNYINLGVTPTSVTVTVSTVGAPGPVAGAGLPGIVLAVAGLLGWRSNRKSRAARAAA